MQMRADFMLGFQGTTMHRTILLGCTRRLKWLTLAVLFAFCQVIGAMCTLPDLSLAADMAMISESGMVCPMDGTIMCPPSITSSPERQIKNSMVMDVDHATILLSPDAVLTVPMNTTLWSWSSASSIVPISIGSSSVLRI